jgi:hypothetical protein
VIIAPVSSSILTHVGEIKVFRRVESKKRTMGEYLEQEFPEVDVHTAVTKETKPDVYNRIADLTHDTDATNYFRSLMNRLPASEKVDLTNMGKNAAANWSYDHEKNFYPGAMEVIGRRSQTHFVTSEQNIDRTMWDHLKHHLYIERFYDVLDYSNHDDWKAVEMISGNIVASARGLAKIGAYMANGGAHQGKRIMSKEAAATFHSDYTKERDLILMYPAERALSGVDRFSEHPVDELPLEEFVQMIKWRSGYVGLSGYGGTVFQWNPEHNISFGYLIGDLTPTSKEPYQMKAARLQGIVKDIIKNKK